VPCLCLIHVCTLPAARMLATVNGQRTLIMQWEDLHIGVQAAAAFVVSFVLLVIAHIALLNQPLGRALWYGLFWGVIATVIVVLGTRAERARRLATDSDSLRCRAGVSRSGGGGGWAPCARCGGDFAPPGGRSGTCRCPAATRPRGAQ